MFMSAGKIIGAGTAPHIPVANMFQINTRTGTSSAGSVTSASFAPDFIITKARSGSTGATALIKSLGTGKYEDFLLSDQTTDAQSVTAFNSNGFSFGTSVRINNTGVTYVDWMFKNTTGFFSCGLATSGGTTADVVNHGLGTVPGAIFIVDTLSTTDGLSARGYISSIQGTCFSAFSWSGSDISSINSTSFSINTSSWGPPNGRSLWYFVFGHNTTSASNVYCGTFSTDVSGNATITGLPFQPQFLIVKRTDSNTTPDADFEVYDTTRGWGGSSSLLLRLGSSATEPATATVGGPTSNGFTISNTSSKFHASANYAYVAINSI